MDMYICTVYRTETAFKSNVPSLETTMVLKLCRPSSMPSLPALLSPSLSI